MGRTQGNAASFPSLPAECQDSPRQNRASSKTRSSCRAPTRPRVAEGANQQHLCRFATQRMYSFLLRAPRQKHLAHWHSGTTGPLGGRRIPLLRSRLLAGAGRKHPADDTARREGHREDPSAERARVKAEHPTPGSPPEEQSHRDSEEDPARKDGAQPLKRFPRHSPIWERSSNGPGVGREEEAD
jgi:hypothetical protein